MNIIFTAALTAGAFYIGTKTTSNRMRQSNTENKEETSQEEAEKEARDNEIANLVATIRNFGNNIDNFHRFKAVEAENGVITYEYESGNKSLFCIRYAHEKSIEVALYYNNENLILYQYDYKGTKNSRVLKKELHPELFSYYRTKDVTEWLNSFFGKAVVFTGYWGQISPKTVIKKRQPSLVVNETKTSEPEKTVSTRDISEDLKYIRQLIDSEENGIDCELLVLFQKIVSKIETCIEHADEMEFDMRHVVEHLMQKDLQHLLAAYNELSQDNQVEVQEKVKSALLVMLNKTNEITELLNRRKIHELEKAVNVIHARNY